MRRSPVAPALVSGLVLAGLFLVGKCRAEAQVPMPPTAQLDAMKKLDWLVGQWKGEGSIEFAPGQQRAFSQKETVQRKLGGVVLLIEGSGSIRLPGRDEEVPAFSALAVVSYDEREKRYRWQAFTGGDYQEAETRLTNDGLQWTLPKTRTGMVRYTLHQTASGAWHEIGESSADGKTWRKFFEMTLRRAE
jgi:Protein of unknown function (DUF1579)